MHVPGTTPPVNMTGNGQATPAISPSTSNCTSRNGLKPSSVLLENVAMMEFGTLLHQNSSSACPTAERERIAFSTFRGMVKVFMAWTSGTMKALPDPLADLRAESGTIMSAGFGTFFVEKNVAVNVVSKEPVYVRSTIFPRSKMTLCGCFQSVR